MLAAAAAAGAVAVAACGPGAVLTADTPGQAVSTAVEAAQTTPLRMNLTADLTVNAGGVSGLPSSIQSALGQLGSGGSATGHLDQESAARREITGSAGGHSLTVVQYDGHGYVSEDGGAYAEFSTTLPSSTTVSTADVSAAVNALGFQDQGGTSVDGVSVEHYSAPITLSALQKLAQSVTASPSAGGMMGSLGQGLALVAPYVSGHGTVDLWLSTKDGSLVRASVSGSMSIDVGAIASALSGLMPMAGASGSTASGSLEMGLSAQADVSDYGGSVTVSKPTATSTLPGWGGSSSLPSSLWSSLISAA